MLVAGVSASMITLDAGVSASGTATTGQAGTIASTDRQQDRCGSVCWQRAGNANISDMADQLDHSDNDGLLRDTGAGDFQTMHSS